MKKFISLTLILCLCLTAFAGCGTKEETPATDAPVETAAPQENNLAAAKEYLFTMYKGMLEATPTDYVVVGTVVVGTDAFEIEWSADSDTIQFVRGDDKMVTVDVDEKNPEEVLYNLTATLKDAAGNVETVSFAHRVPAAILVGGSYEEIVEGAYKLEVGLSMPEAQRLYGEITVINDEYSEKYDNITVTIQVGDLADKPIKCFRLSGDGVKDLKVGDQITVEGILKNYEKKDGTGEIEFDKGCQLIGMGEIVDQTKIVEAAYKLEPGLAMTDPVKLTGVITAVNDEYSEKYDNITVTIQIGDLADKPIKCFRLSGDGVKNLKVGDEITVEGILKNYEKKDGTGEIEFDKGCTLVAVQ